MATELMARSQIMSSMAMPTGASKLAGAASSGMARAVGFPLKRNGQFKLNGVQRRSVTRSVLEAPRVEQASTNGALNPSEILIEKLAAMGAPNDTELHKMSDLADRLFAWDDVPKLGTLNIAFSLYVS